MCPGTLILSFVVQSVDSEWLDVGVYVTTDYMTDFLHVRV